MDNLGLASEKSFLLCASALADAVFKSINSLNQLYKKKQSIYAPPDSMSFLDILSDIQLRKNNNMLNVL